MSETLKNTAKKIRCLLMDEFAAIGIGHVGGSLSIVDALTTLYFEKMNIDPKNPKMANRDQFVLSKGHAGPALYATLAERGYFDRSLLLTLNQPGTILPSHCDMHLTPGVDMTAGSLGQGISCAVGIAKAGKIKKNNSYVYCIIGDGESQEGQVWEASMAAVQLKLDNLIILLDYNNMQIDGIVDDVNSLRKPAKRWESLGFHTIEADGHNLSDISSAIDRAKEIKGVPSLIVLKTIKGKGVSFVEEIGFSNHNMPITKEQAKIAIEEIMNTI